MIFVSGHFPDLWTEGIIIPLFKKGDSSDVNNYRGITLVSVISKLFTSILNQRLTNWCKDNSIITDAQFGFQKGYSTTDAIFCLHGIINHMLNNGKRLYCTFVDMKKCFDSVNRNALWFKLYKLGIRGKMLNIVRNMYSQVRCRVRHCNKFSDFMDILVGLKQGDNCSPLFWAIFIEDLELHLNSNIDSGLNFEDLTIILFLYADDMVLMSENIDDMQRSLDNLKTYCDKWGISVNTEKTKVMVFRKRGALRVNEQWTYGNTQLEIVKSFNYLGVVFDSNGLFNHNVQLLVGKALKAMGTLLYNTREFEFTPKTMLHLFDSFVVSILNYAAEIWGHTKCKEIERVHLKYCKRILNVKLSTSNAGVYGELGRFPLFIGRFVKIIKFWFKIIHSKNCIVSKIYSLLLCDVCGGKSNWVSAVKDILYSNGFGCVWEAPYNTNAKAFVPIFKQRLIDTFIQKWRSDLEENGVLLVYKHMKFEFKYENYLSIIRNKHYRQLITKFRICAHKLRIESGRYGQQRIDRGDRLCEICAVRDIEDEYHFILICDTYKTLRKRYIDKYFYVRPNMRKLLELLSTQNSQTLNNLACFINCACKMRQNLL